MNTSFYSVMTLVVLAATGVCVPINDPNRQGWGTLVAGGFGMCALLSVFMIGTAGVNHCVKGAINNYNNHKAINYYFKELKTYEKEKEEIRKSAKEMEKREQTVHSFTDTG